MSFFQPLITTAFSSYAVSRGAFAERTQGVSNQNEVDQAAQTGITSPSQETQQTHSIDKTQGASWSRESQGLSDRDFGKPKSASGDVLDISSEAQRQLADQEKIDDAEFSQRLQDQADETTKSDNQISVAGSLKSEESGEASASTQSGASSDLSAEEQQQVEELKSRDAEVRLHEQQHVAAGGQFVTSGPSYTYQTGPDGKRYAIGGEVGIDTAPIEGDPEATIQKMQTVAAAATAPAEPSDQDLKVAAAARQAEAQARSEMNAQQAEQMSGASEDSEATNSAASLNSENEESSSSISNRSATATASNFSANNSVSNTYRMVSGQTDGSRFSAFA